MKTYTNAELCLIWIDSFLGLEYKHKQELYKYINGKTDLKQLLLSRGDYIKTKVGEKEFSTLLSSANKSYLDYVLAELERKGVQAITVDSEDYPESLKNTSIPPLVLYCKGDKELLKSKAFAIVGSRKSLPLSISLAESYTEKIVDAGFIPVTGIAEGVDSAVLKKAVEKRAKAISVVAGGLDNVYPKSNFELLEKVAKIGLVVSEYPPETVPKPFHFPVRNRIIAALSKGVLVVSGGVKSGTNYTAEYAEEYGKDLFAVPYSVGVPSGAGCNELIKKGAMLTDSPQDILDFYGVKVKDYPKITLNDSEKIIYDALKEGDLHIEKLCEKVNKRVFEIMPILSILEIKKVVVKSGNVYGLCLNDLEE